MSRLLLCFALITVFISGCGSLENTPVKTIQDQTTRLHKTIEDTLRSIHGVNSYQSLSFGQMKVYKPKAFLKLDSIYALKNAYIENDDLRGLNQSGIEDEIPAYRAEALNVIDQVEYEIEHLYHTDLKDSIRIQHTYFVFDYQDSIRTISPFYSYKVSKSHKEIYYDYQFNQHFVTNRNLYISNAENDFLLFFKEHALQLIKTEAHQDFMDHTMQLMTIANNVGTVDFRSLSRRIILNQLQRIPQEVTVEKLGQLMSFKSNEIVTGYQIEAEWTSPETGGLTNITTINFDPYLQIESVERRQKIN